jgi:2',3'-cyclic-nucleotide 2'-phosphodiesterase (5'-nucleotidase family)
MFRLLRYALLSVLLSACTAKLRVSETQTSHYELKQFNGDSASLSAISPYKDRLDKEMKQIIAYSDSALTRDGFESSLGNFVCMATEEFVNMNRADIADNCVIIINRGGLRNNLPQGEITRGNIFELMPFDNEIVVLKISGQKLMDGIHALLKEKKLISYHLIMKVNDSSPETIIVNNAPFDINKEYTVVTTDYLAMGGDNCSFFAKPVSYDNTGVKLRDAIITYCENLSKDNRTIKPRRFGNIKISK